VEYCGRFAPSPTGDLHFGSLVSALASWLDARAHRGRWLLRIEDLDAARAVPGAAQSILRTLEGLGLAHDGPVEWQRERTAGYADALDRLRQAGLAFACGCTRGDLAGAAAGIDGPVYPGTCRDGLPPGRAPRAWRVRVDDAMIVVEDAIQGRLVQKLDRDVGDFVVRRADGAWAYQLAVVVDDAAQGVTRVVRGADLLDSTPRQCHLQRLLGIARPGYAHVPVAVDAQGRKLSKQGLAPAIDRESALAWLRAALDFLGQPPPATGVGQVGELLAEAIARWDLRRIPACRTRPAPAFVLQASAARSRR
jgi:glutamyl-Q tRNA(Asp) synthetase